MSNLTDANTSINIDDNVDSWVQEVHRNIGQEVFIVTGDRVKLCLIDYLYKVEKKNAWVAPTGICLTIFVTIFTTTFHDFASIKAATWEAGFSIACLLSLGWLICSLKSIRSSITIDDVIKQLKQK